MNYTLFDFIGNIGVFLILLSYFLLQIKKLSSEQLSYSLMNLFGAAFIIVSLTQNFNLSAFVIEAFWVVISFVGIFNYYKNTRAENI